MRLVLSHIHNNVPELLLQAAYNPNKLPVSIDSLIHRKTIMDRVYLYCNLVAGKRREIVLTSDMIVATESTPGQEEFLRLGKYAIYEIPPELRDNKPIVSTIGIGYPNQAITYPWDQMRPTAGATVSKMAKAIMASQTMNGALNTPDVEPVSGSRVMLYPPQYSDFGWVLICNIGYDENFSNLNNQAVLALQDLCLSAVKAYVHIQLVLKIDKGEIIYGGELGSIREMVYKYADEEEKFQDLLSQFNGGAALDTKRLINLVRAMC